ncbi:MAG: regulatory protein RecX [Verrucomicrobia bacterium]|nr:regulatory protein RecX [Verrucomicrobiota bacterium]
MDENADFDAARNAALRSLKSHDRSVHEIAQKLSRKGYEAALIDRVTADLLRVGLLDDEEMARRWVGLQLERKPAGAPWLRSELFRRGVDKQLVELVLEEFADQTGSEAAAVELLRRQRGRYMSLDMDRARRRMLGALARRGFDPETASAAVAIICNTTEQE